MLSQEEEAIAQRLVVICRVPWKFVALVIESETNLNDAMSIEMKIAKYKERVEFLDKIVRTDVSLDDSLLEFKAQCLSLATDLPIVLARMVIKIESTENISEAEEMTVRVDRINFLMKVAAFLMNNSNFQF